MCWAVLKTDERFFLLKNLKKAIFENFKLHEFNNNY
jgi:hypothetical protein